MATISQQKRRITRLQDTHNTLNSKLRKQSKAQHNELQALMEEYRKNTEQYRDIQKKARHFQMSDAKLFQDIWMMNEGKVRELAKEVMHADRVVHTQQLGLDWSQPQEEPSPMEHVLALVKNKLSQATMYASQVLSQAESGAETDRNVAGTQEGGGEGGGEGEGEEDRVRTSSATSSRVQIHPPVIVKRVLELLCEEAGFLLDEKLIRLVAPLEKTEQMMMKLDSMFKSLGIQTEEDIQRLVKYFISDEEELHVQEEGDKVQDKAESEHPMSDTAFEETSIPGASKSDASKITLIHPNNVRLAIHRFVEQRKATSKLSSVSPSALGLSSTAQRELLNGSFWQQMIGILPQSHERVWDALLEGLEQYHSVLLSRSKCIEETKVLNTQNNELRLLLQQYMHSRINDELEIPPTLILPV